MGPMRIDSHARRLGLTAVMIIVIGPCLTVAYADQGYVAAADGARLFYRKVGSGPQALIYLHGGPCSGFRGSGTEMEQLARGRTLVMYDYRGCGRSEVVTDAARLTIEDHLRDLDAVREHFRFTKVTLIGLSWGSGLAALYASAYPDRVDRLVFVSPVSPTYDLFEKRLAYLRTKRGLAVSNRLRELSQSLTSASDAEAASVCRELIRLRFQLYILAPTEKKFRTAQMRCDVPAAALRNWSGVEAAWLASVGKWDFRRLLEALPQPALVMEGAQTEVPVDATIEWARWLRNGRLLLLSNAGHELFLDQKKAFVRAVDQFLRGQNPLGSRVVRAR